MYIYIYAYMYICIYAYMYIHKYTYRNTNLASRSPSIGDVDHRDCSYIYTSICINVYIYLHICIYAYMYIHTCIYIHIQQHKPSFPQPINW